MVEPVVKRSRVMAARTPSATSSGSAAIFNGVVSACLSTPSRPRPRTKSVATAAGEMPMTRISGASTRASKLRADGNAHVFAVPTASIWAHASAHRSLTLVDFMTSNNYMFWIEPIWLLDAVRPAHAEQV